MRRVTIPISIAIFFFLIAFPVLAQRASLFLSPGSESFTIGEIFSVEIKVSTDFPINATQTTVYFPPDKLEVLHLSKESSIFSLWPEEPVFSNTSGRVSFSGGIPHPGFTGIGKIITINFKAKNEGQANLTLGEGRVLADDGKGTDILIFVKEAKYSIQKIIVPPGTKIMSPTHPQEKEWYSNNSPRFQWEMTPDIIGVSFVLDRHFDTIPDTGSEGIFGSQTFSDLDDGIWYFHLRLKNEMGWSEPTHRKIQIDTDSPHPFEIIIDNFGDPTNPSPQLYFETKDDTSGVNYYKLKIGKGDFLDLMRAEINPFSLSFQSPGRHRLIVRAVDEAGNAAEAEAMLDIEPIESPQITLRPEKYIAGEETLYLEGTTFPQAEIIIFLERYGKNIKTWSTSSNNQGEWSFSTNELIKSGLYYLSAKARNKRGAESYPSERYQIEISLSGISLGPFLITFRNLVFFSILILLFGIIIAGYLTFRTRTAKKILRKETQEAKESLRSAFDILKEEIEKRIIMFDAKPEFSEQEKRVVEDLKEVLKTAEESVQKEIEDIEKELK